MTLQGSGGQFQSNIRACSEVGAMVAPPNRSASLLLTRQLPAAAAMLLVGVLAACGGTKTAVAVDSTHPTGSASTPPAGPSWSALPTANRSLRTCRSS